MTSRQQRIIKRKIGKDYIYSVPELSRLIINPPPPTFHYRPECDPIFQKNSLYPLHLQCFHADVRFTAFDDILSLFHSQVSDAGAHMMFNKIRQMQVILSSGHHFARQNHAHFEPFIFWQSTFWSMGLPENGGWRRDCSPAVILALQERFLELSTYPDSGSTQTVASESDATVCIFTQDLFSIVYCTNMARPYSYNKREKTGHVLPDCFARFWSFLDPKGVISAIVHYSSSTNMTSFEEIVNKTPMLNEMQCSTWFKKILFHERKEKYLSHAKKGSLLLQKTLLTWEKENETKNVCFERLL